MDKTDITQASATPEVLLPPVGIFQRKCDCGHHTIAGSRCAECEKKRSIFQRKPAIDADKRRRSIQSCAAPATSHPETASSAARRQDNAVRFGVDFSRVPCTAPARGANTNALQLKAGCAVDAGTAVPPLRLDEAGGTPIPNDLREQAEAVFGTSLGAVRLHTDRRAQENAAQLAARAFTSGHHVYFGAGWYQPHSEPGQQLIGHELTHVIQQRHGLSAARLRGVGDDYEQEADRGGAAFARGQPTRVGNSGGDAHALQRSADPGADAERVGSDDSPYGFPFLGMANTYEELVALMQELSAEEGEPLGLVAEEFAMGGGESAEAVALAPPQAEVPLQASVLDQPIQRAVVAGCVVPALPANLIGIAAHMQIGAHCGATAPVCLGGGHPGFQIPGAGRPDIVRQRPPFIDEVGEIKPASFLGRGIEATAAAQLAADLASYNAIIGPAVPMWSYRFTGAPFVLNPTQQLRAWGPSGGLYFYSCTGGRRRRVRIRVRIPSPMPVPVPVPTPVPVPRKTPTAVKVGAGIGIGYVIYRGLRMIPSLFPPLWPTIPANAAIP